MKNTISIRTTFDPRKDLSKLIKKASIIIDEEMLKAVVNLEKNSPVGVTGDLKSGWDLKPVAFVNNEFLIRITNDTPFSLNRLEGRKPGKMPPSSALESWVALKLRVPAKEVKRVAFLVARKIGKEGTNRSKRNFKEFNPVDGQPAKNGSIDRAIQKIAKRLNTEL